MARARSPNRDKAFEIYKENEGNITNREIAKILDEDEKVIAVWKSRDKWNKKINVVQQSNKSCTTKEKKELQHKKTQRNRSGNPNPNNQFAKRNKAAEKHGFFSKIFPPETLDIVEDIIIKDPLDMLWENIIIQYTAIARSQMIMHVESKEEMIKELKKSKVKTSDRRTEKTSTNSSEEEYEYEFQFAWDRQATFLNAQSRAMSELRSLIKQYDEMINSGLGTEEQKLRIEKLKIDIENAKGDGKGEEAKSWAEAIQEIAAKRRGKNG